MIGAAVVGVALLTACAADIDNRPLTEGLLITGAYAMGVVESVSITTSTFPLRSQEEIGQGGGLSGSTRNFVSAIAVAVYTATLNNRLNQTVPQQVRAVALQAGLPEGSLPALYAALRGTGSFTAVPGINNAIQAAVQEPYRVAFKNAAATVFLVSLAFSGTALILSFFTTNNDKSTENYVYVCRTPHQREIVITNYLLLPGPAVCMAVARTRITRRRWRPRGPPARATESHL
jgi:hypothetical protein